MRKLLVIIVILLISASAYFLWQRGENVKGVKAERIIRGAIIPHHKFADEIISDTYAQVANEGYEYVVVIGPNHFYPDYNKVVTGDSDSQLLVSDKIVDDFVSYLDLVQVQNEVVLGEHSVTLQAQYISQFLPDTQIIPVVLYPRIDDKVLDSLADYLAGIDGKVLYIASVDFAHDLSYPQAMENNSQSISAIQRFDYEAIKQYDNSHMDSPESISLLMKIMEEKQSIDFQVLHNTHGAMLIDDPALQGTSYVVGVFSK